MPQPESNTPAGPARVRLQIVLIAIPACIATLVLLGWWAGNDDLQRLWLSRVKMNPASAVALLLLTGSMACSRIRSRHGRLMATGLDLSAGAIGVLILADDLFATGFRPDKLLFAKQIAAATGPNNRMAPNAALVLLLLCGSILAAGRGTPRGARLAQSLALSAMAVAGFAIVGHLYNVTILYGVGAYFPMAAHTATGFIATAIYLLLTTRHGPAMMLADEGAAGAMVRRLIPAALSLPVVVGGLGLFLVHAQAVPADNAVAVMVVMNAVVMTALVALTAFSLRTADRARRAAEIGLIKQARTDFLTGLPNRARFMEHLIQRMAPNERQARANFVVIYMDLDGFKAVNDTLGHAAGDRLLQEVAAHLRGCVRPGDVIARFGGDEFTILLDQVNSVEDATRVASRIVETMPKHVVLGTQKVPVGISVGLVMSEPRHRTLEGLLSDADEALYRAKKGGRGQFIVYPQSEGAVAA